jgi:high frequency lysogenization protein
MRDRALALAGLAQAVELVVRIANHGEADADTLKASLDSLFRLDADSTEAVFAGAWNVRPGLRALLSHLKGGDAHSAAAMRIALTVLQVERKLARREDLLRKIADGLARIDAARDRSGAPAPETLQQLGDLYAATVSQLSPRVLVQGNPMHLSQAGVVAEIRAVLFAAVRAAVLWRQLGGSYWDLTLRRGAIVSAAQAWLQRGQQP